MRRVEKKLIQIAPPAPSTNAQSIDPPDLLSVESWTHRSNSDVSVDGTHGANTDDAHDAEVTARMAGATASMVGGSAL